MDALHLGADVEPAERHADPEHDAAAEHDQDEQGAAPAGAQQRPSPEAEPAGAALEQLAQPVEGAAEGQPAPPTSSTGRTSSPAPSAQDHDRDDARPRPRAWWCASESRSRARAPPAPARPARRSPGRRRSRALPSPPAPGQEAPDHQHDAGQDDQLGERERAPQRRRAIVDRGASRAAARERGCRARRPARVARPLAAGRVALGAGAAGRRGRAPARLACALATSLPIARATGRRCPMANGQPLEIGPATSSCSIPSRPQRGRTCQCLQPGSPMSSLLTRTHLCSSGASSISSMRRRCFSST